MILGAHTRFDKENATITSAKTPKAVHGGASRTYKNPFNDENSRYGKQAFITPVGPRRVPLGGKSTNIKARYLTEAGVLTQKRHSPKQSKGLGSSVVTTATASAVENGPAAARAALDRAIATGIDLPEPEYMPPKVTPLPFVPDPEEDGGPIDMEMVNLIHESRSFLSDAWFREWKFVPRPFVYMEYSSEMQEKKSANGTKRPVASMTRPSSRPSTMRSVTRPAKVEERGFAAPTLSQQARTKVEVNNVNSARSARTSRTRFTGSGIAHETSASSTSQQQKPRPKTITRLGTGTKTNTSTSIHSETQEVAKTVTNQSHSNGIMSPESLLSMVEQEIASFDSLDVFEIDLDTAIDAVASTVAQ